MNDDECFCVYRYILILFDTLEEIYIRFLLLEEGFLF